MAACRITVSLPAELFAAVQQVAREQWATPASFCRFAIAAAVAARSAQAVSDVSSRRAHGKSSDLNIGSAS